MTPTPDKVLTDEEAACELFGHYPIPVTVVEKYETQSYIKCGRCGKIL